MSIITLKILEGITNMRFIYLLFFSALAGCAHVVIEERLVPLSYKGTGGLDNNLYHPKDISDTVSMGTLELSVRINNYQTSYSGLQIAGIEVEREPNSTDNQSNRLVLILGVRGNDNNVSYPFQPSKIKVNRYNQGQLEEATPILIYKTKRSMACESDFDGLNWGGNSEEVANNVLNYLEVNDDEFECFNIVFNIDKSNLSELSLNFEDTLLPLNKAKIYFHPKKIKWIRSN